MPSKTTQTTTEQGYGWTHQQRRRELIAALQDGDPCARCQGPMYRHEAATLHADHVGSNKANGELADALSHGPCNMSHGATEGNRARAGTEHRILNLAIPRTSRDW